MENEEFVNILRQPDSRSGKIKKYNSRQKLTEVSKIDLNARQKNLWEAYVPELPIALPSPNARRNRPRDWENETCDYKLQP